MGRLVDTDLLVGSSDIAERLGVSNRVIVHAWTKRDPTFPAPLATIGRTGIWDWPDIEVWARATKRLPCRPSARPTRRAGKERSRR